MPVNLQERQQFLPLPAGWSAPQFTFGQTVRWEIPNPHLKIGTAWGKIIGLSFWEGEWVYEVLPSSDCRPLAIAHPATWGTGDDLEMLPAERLTLMAG